MLGGIVAYVAYQISQAKKKGLAETAWEAIAGEPSPKADNSGVNVEIAAGGGKQIQLLDPGEFGTVSRGGGFAGLGNDYSITVRFVNGTTYPWGGNLSVITTENVGDPPTVTTFDQGDFSIAENSSIDKVIPLAFHGHYINIGSTNVVVKVKLATVEGDFSFYVD